MTINSAHTLSPRAFQDSKDFFHHLLLVFLQDISILACCNYEPIQHHQYCRLFFTCASMKTSQPETPTTAFDVSVHDLGTDAIRSSLTWGILPKKVLKRKWTQVYKLSTLNRLGIRKPWPSVSCNMESGGQSEAVETATAASGNPSWCKSLETLGLLPAHEQVGPRFTVGTWIHKVEIPQHTQASLFSFPTPHEPDEGSGSGVYEGFLHTDQLIQNTQKKHGDVKEYFRGVRSPPQED